MFVVVVMLHLLLLSWIITFINYCKLLLLTQTPQWQRGAPGWVMILLHHLKSHLKQIKRNRGRRKDSGVYANKMASTGVQPLYRCPREAVRSRASAVRGWRDWRRRRKIIITIIIRHWGSAPRNWWWRMRKIARWRNNSMRWWATNIIIIITTTPVIRSPWPLPVPPWHRPPPAR